jgi:hypothetical protein
VQAMLLGKNTDFSASALQWLHANRDPSAKNGQAHGTSQFCTG